MQEGCSKGRTQLLNLVRVGDQYLDAAACDKGSYRTERVVRKLHHELIKFLRSLDCVLQF